MNRWVGLGLLLIIAGALGLRCPQLDRRPMHNDEGVNALKIQGLWERGVYAYDPDEYHGPSLSYATLPFVWLSGARDFAQLSEKPLRLAPVFFGVLLILLLWWMRDGLGSAATLWAGSLLAISPAMVFYSRYFIHEMLLVCFTMVVLVAGWRYLRARRIGWAILGGAGLGLMHATKETFAIAVAAMGLAIVATWWWIRREGKAGFLLSSLWNPKHAAAAASAGIVVSVALFTSFFTHWSGPVDSVRSYLPWLHRAGGHSTHIHPFGFYLERLAYFHQSNGPIWSEGLILFLAAAGMVAAFTGKGLGAANRWLARFLALYTIILTLAYGLISYKTPWCMLGFLHGLILLAGLGAASLLQACSPSVAAEVRRRIPDATPDEDPPPHLGGYALWLQASVAIVLLAASAHLGWQAWGASFVFESDRRNPYVYAQTLPDILDLVEQVEALAKVYPQGLQMPIQLIAPDNEYGPLQWYLRRFQRLGGLDHVPEGPYAPVIIVGSKLSGGLGAKLKDGWSALGIYGLRPGTLLQLYVESKLWQRHLEAMGKSKQ